MVLRLSEVGIKDSEKNIVRARPINKPAIGILKLLSEMNFPMPL